MSTLPCATCAKGVRVAGAEEVLDGGDLVVWCQRCAKVWSDLAHAERAIPPALADVHKTRGAAREVVPGAVVECLPDGRTVARTSGAMTLDAAQVHAIRAEMDNRARAAARLRDAQERYDDLLRKFDKIALPGGAAALLTRAAPCKCWSCQRLPGGLSRWGQKLALLRGRKRRIRDGKRYVVARLCCPERGLRYVDASPNSPRRAHLPEGHDRALHRRRL